MDGLSAVFEISSRLVEKVREMREIHPACLKLSDIVSKLQPIFGDLNEHLRESQHRAIMENLKNALNDAEEVVDYIIEHPRLTKYLRSGKYKKKLENAMKDIDNWIIRIQPLTSGETLNNLSNLKNDVNEFSNELNNKLDDISGKIDNLSIEVMRQMREELSLLVHPVGKSPRFQQFVDDEEKLGATIVGRALEAPILQIAKNAGQEGEVVLDRCQRMEFGMGWLNLVTQVH